MPIAELVIAVSGKAVGAAVGPLLRDLIELQDRQAKALEALHAGGPYGHTRMPGPR